MNDDIGVIPKKRDKKRSFIVRTILNGFLVALPIVILIAVFVVLIRFVLGIIAPLAHMLSPGREFTHWSLHIVAFIIVCAVFFSVGILIKTRIGKSYFLRFENSILKPLPLYKSISGIVEQFVNRDARPFQKVVLCDPYGSGSLMTGFIVEVIDDDIVVVYVPTAPNPTNGFIFHMKRKDIIETTAKTEDAMATVIGMGTGSKRIFGEKVYDEVYQKI